MPGRLGSRQRDVAFGTRDTQPGRYRKPKASEALASIGDRVGEFALNGLGVGIAQDGDAARRMERRRNDLDLAESDLFCECRPRKRLLRGSGAGAAASERKPHRATLSHASPTQAACSPVTGRSNRACAAMRVGWT